MLGVQHETMGHAEGRKSCGEQDIVKDLKKVQIEGDNKIEIDLTTDGIEMEIIQRQFIMLLLLYLKYIC